MRYEKQSLKNNTRINGIGHLNGEMVEIWLVKEKCIWDLWFWRVLQNCSLDKSEGRIQGTWEWILGIQVEDIKLKCLRVCAVECDYITGEGTKDCLKVGFFNLSPIDIFGQTILWCGDCPVHCRMVSGISSLESLDTSSSSTVLITKNISRHW